MKNTFYNLLIDKSRWFNTIMGLPKFQAIAPAKEHLSISLKEFLNGYDRLYIHKKTTVIEGVKGLAQLLDTERYSKIKTVNFTDLLVRGYTHDFRIIIYILLSFGLTLWFNTEPFKIPQILHTHSVISTGGYIYEVGKQVLNFNQSSVTESTRCIINQIPPHLLPIWPFDFDSSTITIKYILEDFNQGLTEVLRICPDKLCKRMCLIHLAEARGYMDLVFDPLGMNAYSSEYVDIHRQDWIETQQSHETKRVKSTLFFMGISILLMGLIESSGCGISS